MQHVNTSHLQTNKIFSAQAQWEHSAVSDFYWLLKRAFATIVGPIEARIGQPLGKLYIRGWAFCLEEGLKLQWHHHAEYSGEFVMSGSFAVSVGNGSATLFQLPSATGKILRSRNRIGDLQMFNGSIAHSTTEVDSAQMQQLAALHHSCRLTAAWDVRTRPIAHTLPFYDPADPQWVADPEARAMLQRKPDSAGGRDSHWYDRGVNEGESLKWDASKARWASTN
jgi:hypothetical protein